MRKVYIGGDEELRRKGGRRLSLMGFGTYAETKTTQKFWRRRNYRSEQRKLICTHGLMRDIETETE